MLRYTCPVHGEVTRNEEGLPAVTWAGDNPICAMLNDSTGTPFANDDTNQCQQTVRRVEKDGQTIEYKHLVVCNGYCGESLTEELVAD